MNKATTIMPSVVFCSTDRTSSSNTIVLQPLGCLAGLAVLDFQANLEQALETAALGVVVDLQQVEALALEGINALVIGLELAAILGKSIVFQSMDLASRKSFIVEWSRAREICFGPWGDLFEGELEKFFGVEILRSQPC
ncbi:MAG: STAS domain-containing protein [Microcoleus sp.]